MHSYDIVIVSFPYTVVEIPPLGPAVLKGAVESEGFKAKVFDLGMELYKHLDKDQSKFDQFQQYFSEFIETAHVSNEADEFLEKWSKTILEHNPRWVGFSIFSQFSQLAAYIFSKKLTALNPDVKIVVGGPGASIDINDSIAEFCQATSAERMIPYGNFLKKRKLVTECVYGDGEQALVDLLSAELTVKDFYAEDYKTQVHPFANFDDYNLYDYKGQLGKGFPQIPIFSSKGCVRSCDFCDVNKIHQNKFRFRVGKNIADEMIFLAEKYKINDFIFVDSLANGSLKNLKEWMTVIAEHNKNNPDKRIAWSASGWICRPEGQMPPAMYKLMADSGCESVAIGAESGSNRVLEYMVKKTTVESLFYEANELTKNNINFMLMLIVGHWSETWEDFLQTCVMLLKLVKHAKAKTLIGILTGYTFIPKSGTPVYDERSQNKLVVDSHNTRFWWTSENPELTFKERYFRLILLQRLIKTLNLPLGIPIGNAVYHTIDKFKDQAEQFYRNITQESDLSAQCAEYYWDNFDEFMSEVLKLDDTASSDISLALDLDVSVTNLPLPKIEVLWNGESVFSSELTEGHHSIDIKGLTQEYDTQMSIRFSNKLPNDTLVDSDGNILKDKYVMIKSFKINDFDMINDPEFFYQNFKYFEEGSATTVKAGFWKNESELFLDFEYPFAYWYATRSDLNNKLDAQILTEASLLSSENRFLEDDEEFIVQSAKLLSKMSC